MENKIICPFCKEEQDVLEAYINHFLGESFEVICDNCGKEFLCYYNINYESFPDGIYKKNIFTEDISEKIIEKLKEAKNLYQSNINVQQIYTTYQIEEDLVFFNINLNRLDYIITPYSINGVLKKITKYSLYPSDSYTLDNCYCKIY
jgi:hypothetical protein